jgi:hypothetical protein
MIRHCDAPSGLRAEPNAPRAWFTASSAAEGGLLLYSEYIWVGHKRTLLLSVALYMQVSEDTQCL